MTNDDALSVLCLCAGWCGVCRDYRATFDVAAGTFGGRARFSWFDIEDDAALLDDVDVENFPTVLIARGTELRFCGPLLPHLSTLARTVEAARRSVLTPTSPGVDAAVLDRLQRIAAERSRS